MVLGGEVVEREQPFEVGGDLRCRLRPLRELPGEGARRIQRPGALRTSERSDEARRFLEFMLGEEAQRYYAETNSEYPLVAGVPSTAGLTPIAGLEPPAIDLSDLADLEGTLRLLRSTGVLP